MKRSDFTKYIGVFVLAVLIIAVYKTFDSIGVIFEYLGNVLSVFTPILIGFLIAFVLYPVCVKFEVFFEKSKKKFIHTHRRGTAVIAIYILFVLAIAAFGSILFPAIAQSVSDFINQLPTLVRNIQKFAKSAQVADFKLAKAFENLRVSDILGQFDFTNVKMYLGSVISVSKVVINFLLSMIISMYILLDRQELMRTARRVGDLIFPKKSREVIMKYINRTFTIMYKYSYCQVTDALIVAILASLLLVVMRVRYAPVLGIFIGLFNLIPYFGAISSCVITALLTVFTSSLSKGIWVAVMLTVLQQIDANVIQPRLVRNALEIRPFWVLCGVSVGGGLFGIPGIILAVPMMALVKTVFDDYIDYCESKKSASNDSENEEITQ